MQVNSIALIVKAQDLRPGDQIVQNFEGRYYRYLVDDVASIGHDTRGSQTRVRCNDETITFFLDNDEEVVIERPDPGYKVYCLMFPDRFNGEQVLVWNSVAGSREAADLDHADRVANGCAFEGEYVALIRTADYLRIHRTAGLRVHL